MRNLIFSAFAFLFLVQCATATRGPMQTIRVATKPPGASVEFHDCDAINKPVSTPASVLVSRRATRCTLTLSHHDYGTRTVALLRKGSAFSSAPMPEGFDTAERESS